MHASSPQQINKRRAKLVQAVSLEIAAVQREMRHGRPDRADELLRIIHDRIGEYVTPRELADIPNTANFRD
jgi:hypothetical protein